MTDDDRRSDAERLAIGRSPLQDERLYDRDDLWRVLQRLGHERGDEVPTADWESVDWTCPLDGCDGRLDLVDTGMSDLPQDPAGLDDSIAEESVRGDTLAAARSPTEPLVVCNRCGGAFEANFRRLRDPEESSLPEPRIVETADTLSGSPRIDGTRIGVKHVLSYSERGREPEEIAREVFPVLTEAHVEAAIDWAEAHPDRLAADRRRDREARLRHDVLQSAVDAAVAESLDGIWSVMTNSRVRDDLDPMRPVATHLRNGFENAGGLDLSVDEERRRIVIDVDDGVVARLNDDIEASQSDAPGDDSGQTADVNERVVDEWVAETTAFERVRSVMSGTTEPASLEEIADRAQTSPDTARTHLDRLAAIGHVRAEGGTDEETVTRYHRDPLALVGEQAREMLAEMDAAEIDDSIAEMEARLDSLREEHGVPRPEAAPQLDDAVRRDWTTTRRNLHIARVARWLDEAASVAVPSAEDRR